MKIAVIGSGISGLGASWALSQRFDVTLYEAAARPGGHANTVDIAIDGRDTPVDTGFIVYNEANYPNLTRLFATLGVTTEPSDMSFAVSIGGGRLEYFGSAAGLFAQPSNLLRPRYWRMLRDLLRFYREAPRVLSECAGDEPCLGDLLVRGGYSQAFARDHLLPMGAAIWSSSLDRMLEFPAGSFVRFFVNHGLLNLGARPQWRTVSGGSRAYVHRIAATLKDGVRLSTPVVAARRTSRGVSVRDGGGREERFDQLVLATHGDQALAILGQDATPLERQVLGAFRYQENRAVLHRDPALMPRRRRVWASWNYLADAGPETDRAVMVSYWMNRLQNLRTRDQVFVTLNPTREPESDLTLGTFLYDHPQFDRAAVEAQRLLPRIQGADRTWFCGSYCGYGFHEDGLSAGLDVAAALGAPAPWHGDAEAAARAAPLAAA